MEVVLLRKWYILCFLLCLCGHVDAQNKEYWLDEVYQASYCVQDWGMPQKKSSGSLDSFSLDCKWSYV